jgi:hypothetical protein
VTKVKPNRDRAAAGGQGPGSERGPWLTRARGSTRAPQRRRTALVTEEALGVTFVTAAIENAPGTPSEAFLPVLKERRHPGVPPRPRRSRARSVAKVRTALEGLGIGYGVQTDRPGRWYEYPGDPIARGIGTPVSHTIPQ